MVLQLLHNLGWREIIGKEKLDARKAAAAAAPNRSGKLTSWNKKLRFAASFGMEIPEQPRDGLGAAHLPCRLVGGF
jgi:hypothetical protein